MNRSRLARNIVASLALLAAACGDVTAPERVAAPDAPARGVIVGDTTGGGFTTQSGDRLGTCDKEGDTQVVDGTTYTCKSGGWIIGGG